MLQIFLYGTKESGWLDVNPGTALDIESTSDLFDEDLTAGEFSLPVDLPWTDNNRRLMGFAERLSNFGNNPLYWRCNVYNDGFPEMLNAKITLLEKNGNLSYRKGSFSASISGTKGLFGSTIRNKKLTDLQLGGTIKWTGKNSRKFAEDHMKGLYPQYPYLAFAPVAIMNFFDGFDDGIREDHDIALVKDTVNNIIVYGSGANSWLFGRPDPDNPTSALTSGDFRIRDYRTVPFFRLKFVIKKIFEESGFIVSGDWIESQDFDDVFIFNTTSLEKFGLYARYNFLHEDYNTSIVPQRHVPDMLIKDYLKGFFQFFNIFPQFVGSNEVRLVYREQYINNRAVAGIGNYCKDEFTSSFENAVENKGYTVQYDFDSADSYPGEAMPNKNEVKLVATVAGFANLSNLNIGRQLTTDDIAFVEADNTYYRVADASGSPIKWDAFSFELYAAKTGDGERTVDIEMTPLCQYFFTNEATGFVERKDMVAASQNGSYISSKTGMYIKHEFGSRIFYIKMLNRNGNLLPVSFIHNRDAGNSKIVPYSLALNGPDGMYVNFHKQWQDIRSRMEIVKTTMQYDKRIQKEVAGASMLEINGVKFLIYKSEPTIPSRGTIDIQLVPV